MTTTQQPDREPTVLELEDRLAHLDSESLDLREQISEISMQGAVLSRRLREVNAHRYEITDQLDARSV